MEPCYQWGLYHHIFLITWTYCLYQYNFLIFQTALKMFCSSVKAGFIFPYSIQLYLEINLSTADVVSFYHHICCCLAEEAFSNLYQ